MHGHKIMHSLLTPLFLLGVHDFKLLASDLRLFALAPSARAGAGARAFNAEVAAIGFSYRRVHNVVWFYKGEWKEAATVRAIWSPAGYEPQIVER